MKTYIVNGHLTTFGTWANHLRITATATRKKYCDAMRKAANRKSFFTYQGIRYDCTNAAAPIARPPVFAIPVTIDASLEPPRSPVRRLLSRTHATVGLHQDKGEHYAG